MAQDLETGEIGNAADLFMKAVARRRKKWDDHLVDGMNRVKAWTRENHGRYVSPTRFYKLVHNTPSF